MILPPPIIGKGWARFRNLIASDNMSQSDSQMLYTVTTVAPPSKCCCTPAVLNGIQYPVSSVRLPASAPAVDLNVHRATRQAEARKPFALVRLLVKPTAAALLVLVAVAAVATDVTAASALLVYSNYTLSSARDNMAATSVSNLALFGGGNSDMVDLFNSISGVWTTASLSVYRRWGMAATSVSNLALFGGGVDSLATNVNAVDIFNATSRLWTTASLSFGRSFLAATSVSNLVLFGGGQTNSATQSNSNVVDIFNATSGVWTTAILSVGRWNLAATSVSNLALFGGGSGNFGVTNVVDIFNATSGIWTTATLSSPRYNLAATSVSNLALFGGGYGSPYESNVVDIFNATSAVWTTAILSVARMYLVATSLSNLALFGGGDDGYSGIPSNIVDIFNATSGLWTTASLSVARWGLSATSVSNMALFAGGQISSGGPYTSAVDILLSGCLSGYALIGTVCQSCPSGVFCPPASTSPPIPCAPGCFCPARSGVSTPCPAGAYNPNPGARSASDCRPCTVGSYNPGGQPALKCTLCVAGTFNPSTGSNSSSSCMACGLGTYNPTPGGTSSTACLPCDAGSYGDSTALSACKPCSLGYSNPARGSSSLAACVPCAAGTFANASGSSSCIHCSAGTFNRQNGSSSAAACLPCPPGQANPNTGQPSCSPCASATFAPAPGSSACGACPAGLYCPQQSTAGIPCPAGSSCPVGSDIPCVCKAFEYQPSAGKPDCLPCPLAISPRLNAVTCQSQAAASSFLIFFYLALALVFACISIAAAVLAVRLLRSRHTFSLRTVRVGMCVYVAMFVPYAGLQAATLGQLATLNSQGSSSIARAAADISSSAAFAAFFGLGFSGKVALVQMWTHVVEQHTIGSGSAPLQLQHTMTRTYKAFVWAVAITVVLYVIGFAVLTGYFMSSSSECASQQGSACVSSAQALQQPCLKSLEWTSVLQYYEGAWAAVVLVVFTLLAFLFNGVVFAMCVRCACAVMQRPAIVCDSQQVDRGAGAVAAPAHDGALAVPALVDSAAAAQRLDCPLQDGWRG
jgi:hypothetical protein